MIPMKDYMGVDTPFKYGELKTLTGMTLPEALAEMQKKLDAGGYKPVPGADYLTDINPAYMTEVVTKVFGLVGFGWYYSFDDIKVTPFVQRTKNGERNMFGATISNFWLIYRLTDGERVYESEPVRATGGSDSDDEGYALRGAITNALGAAFAKLLWQLPVYKGEYDNKKKEFKNKPEPVTKPDNKPWYQIALDYAKARETVWAQTLGATREGQRLVEAMRKNMVGPNKLFMADSHLMNAVKAYTGFKVPEEMGWPDFEKLMRVYHGPQALPGTPVKEVLFQHFIQPSDWQEVLATIGLDPDFMLDEMTAAAFNTALVGAPAYTKNKKLDVPVFAEQLRKHFVANAEVVDPATAQELAEAVDGVEPIAY